MAKITITVSPVGKVSIDTEGFVGQSCQTATAGLEKALAGGNGEIDRVLKPEWAENNHETERSW